MRRLLMVMLSTVVIAVPGVVGILSRTGVANAVVGQSCVGPSATFENTNWKDGATIPAGFFVRGDLHACAPSTGAFGVIVQFSKVGQPQMWNVHTNTRLTADRDSGALNTFYIPAPDDPGGTYEVLAILRLNQSTVFATSTLRFTVAR